MIWKKWASNKRLESLPATGHVVLKVEGGLGAQIISMSAFFLIAEQFSGQGRSVYLDLRYFDQPEKIAGKDEGCSQWAWALQAYGLPLDQLAAKYAPLPSQGAKPFCLNDGPLKTKLALTGLKHPSIRAKFPVQYTLANIEPYLAHDDQKFCVLHIRQGDYLNVASHVVPPHETLPAIRPISNLVDTLTICSDSQLPAEFLAQCRKLFKRVLVLVDRPMDQTHDLMRQAHILITSNSTYSLTAACLNEAGLVLIPKKWFGPENKAIENEILSRTTLSQLTM